MHLVQTTLFLHQMNVLGLVLSVATSVVLFPFHYILLPPVLLVVAVVNHVIVIPMITLVRILILGFVYIPMLPFLHTLSIEHDYDNNSRIEVTVYKIVLSAYPHLRFFMINLLHYFVVCAAIGVIFGIVASGWLNFSSLMFNSVTPSSKKHVKQKDLYTQTTPYLNKLMNKVDPVIKVENSPGPLFDLSNHGDDTEMIYEDDDGYDYSIQNSDYYDTNLSNLNSMKNEFDNHSIQSTHLDSLRSDFDNRHSMKDTLRSDFDVSTINTELTIPEEDETEAK